MTAADDPNAVSELLPRPDPSRLTTDQLRRELSALREILTARLDAMDTATALLSETVNRTPTQIQTEIAHVRELMTEKLTTLGGSATEKFSSIDLQFHEIDRRYQQRFVERDLRFEEQSKGIELQFAERDVRTSQAATASAQALAAALQAAKEAVFEQAQAAAKAAEKTELSFSKQIDQIQLQITTVAEGLGDKIDDLKGRIDRGEGSTSGTASYREDRREDDKYTQADRIAVGAQARATISIAIAAAAALMTLAAVLYAVIHG